MDLTCGDAFGIGCGTWIALWNGAIGAFFAAIVGGLVALLVVRLTNAQQRRHAEHSREIEAIAHFVGALGNAYENLNEVEGLKPREMMASLFAAVTRLRMAGPGTAHLYTAIESWPTSLVHLAVVRQSGATHKIALGVDIPTKLSEAYVTALTLLPTWHSSHAPARAAIHSKFTDLSKELDQMLETALALLPTDVSSHGTGDK